MDISTDILYSPEGTAVDADEKLICPPDSDIRITGALITVIFLLIASIVLSVLKSYGFSHTLVAIGSVKIVVICPSGPSASNNLNFKG